MCNTYHDPKQNFIFKAALNTPNHPKGPVIISCTIMMYRETFGSPNTVQRQLQRGKICFE